MSKLAKGKTQLNIRLTDDGRKVLDKLQAAYTRQAELVEPISQAATIEKALRAAFKALGKS